MLWHMLGRGAQDTSIILLASMVIAGLFSLAIAGLVRLLLKQTREASFLKLWLELFFVSAAFAVIGITSGFLTGVSRSPAVSALVPGVLTLFGGLVAYLMSRGLAQALLTTVAVVTFSATLLLGTIAGSLMRQSADDSENSIAKGYRESERELAIQVYRKSLGLPPASQDEKKKYEK